LSTFSIERLLKNGSTECNQIWYEPLLGEVNKFCVNEGDGTRGAGPNRGNKKNLRNCHYKYCIYLNSINSNIVGELLRPMGILFT